MKPLFTLLGMLLIWHAASAQNPLPDSDQLNAFHDSKTMVVLEGGLFSAYNIAMKETMNDLWTITPFEFIDGNRFEDLMADSTYSFLMVTYSRFERDRSSRRYSFLNLLLGSDVESLSELPEFGHIPLTYYGDEDEGYSYKLKFLVAFLQDRVQALKDEPDINAMKSLNYYNKNASLVKEHTLYLVEEDIEPELRSPDALRDYYPYPVEIVTAEELEEIITGSTAPILFLHKVGPRGMHSEGWTFKMIFDTAGNLYYYDRHTINSRKPNALLSSDLKRIAR
jgi:hypothetical protein